MILRLPFTSKPANNKKAHKNVEIIEPGLVVLRKFVSDRDARKFAKIANKMGNEAANGFYAFDEETGEKKLNTGEKRGRIYDAATRFPGCFTQQSNRAVEVARSADSSMPDMTCTHILLNMYTSTEGLVWHRDIYENDGKSDHPVVNLTIGASCVFAFKHNDNDLERVVVLRNGDVLLFGGPCRLIKHAVLGVLLDDCPKWMKKSPCRFSFTFRDSPEVLGREDEFKYFKVSEHLVGQEEFKVPEDRKSFRGLPAALTQSARKLHIDSRLSPSSSLTDLTEFTDIVDCTIHEECGEDDIKQDF